MQVCAHVCVFACVYSQSSMFLYELWDEVFAHEFLNSPVSLPLHYKQINLKGAIYCTHKLSTILIMSLYWSWFPGPAVLLPECRAQRLSGVVASSRWGGWHPPPLGLPFPTKPRSSTTMFFCGRTPSFNFCNSHARLRGPFTLVCPQNSDLVTTFHLPPWNLMECKGLLSPLSVCFLFLLVVV